MKYTPRLDENGFSKPVKFRMRYADTDTGVFPSYDVQSLLEDHHGLEYEHEFDLALGNPRRAPEFVFDAAKVPDADIVISTVQEIVDRFNQPRTSCRRRSERRGMSPKSWFPMLFAAVTIRSSGVIADWCRVR